MSRKHRNSPSNTIVEDPLTEVRRAALELRHQDSAEAVRVLRRVLKAPGEVAVLAHGALAEILLDEFADTDAAAHHFSQVVKLAPDVAAGHLGVARALAAGGDPDGAHAAFTRALALLVTSIEKVRASPPAPESAEIPDDAEGPTIDADAIAILELLADDRALRDEQHGTWTPLVVDPAVFAFVEESRAFDDDADSDDVADWVAYASRKAALEPTPDAAERELARLVAYVPLPAAARDDLFSELHERAGDVPKAAEFALKSVADTSLPVDPSATLRAADLLVDSDRRADARGLLERTIVRLDAALAEPTLPDEFRDELKAAREEVRARLAELTTPNLVGLGKSALSKRHT